MTTTIQDVMTTELVMCPSSTTIGDAARLMRDRNIGDVLVTRDGDQLAGIVTDRDLVVRCLADGAAADATIAQACSSDLTTVGLDSSIDDAVNVMRERSLRRVPVVDGGRAVGIVTLGDLAVERDPDSALGEISAAPASS
ncbi:MAG TPA: CBS domain-containing protein [Ilumatobacter sp.]|nr:CBS domain-containing protein [Ilumatobacter sp.]